MKNDGHELHEKLNQLDQLIADSENHADPASHARLSECVQMLMEIHAIGLRRTLDQLAPEQLAKLASDDAIAALLLLHELHPDDLPARVQRALDSVAPYLASHGGHVELISAGADGAVALRLQGSCHGCPSSRVTLQSTIEQAIYSAAPDVTGISVEGLIEEAPTVSDSFVPLEQLAINGHAAAATVAAAH